MVFTHQYIPLAYCVSTNSHKHYFDNRPGICFASWSICKYYFSSWSNTGRLRLIAIVASSVQAHSESLAHHCSILGKSSVTCRRGVARARLAHEECRQRLPIVSKIFWLLRNMLTHTGYTLFVCSTKLVQSFVQHTFYTLVQVLSSTKYNLSWAVCWGLASMGTQK